MGLSCLITINTLNKAERDVGREHVAILLQETGSCFHMFWWSKHSFWPGKDKNNWYDFSVK